MFHRLVEEEFEKLKRDIKKKEALEIQERQRRRKPPNSQPQPASSQPAMLVTGSQSRSSFEVNNESREFADSRGTFPQNSTSAISTNSNANSQHNNHNGSGNSNGSGNASSNSSTPSSSHSASATQSSSSSGGKSGGRFKIGGFFNKAVRPFSINVASSWSAPEKVVSTNELPDIKNLSDRSKASIQVKLFNCKPLIIHSSDIEGFFKLIDADGQEHCFQALSDSDAHDWVRSINEAKRYSYLSKEARDKNGAKVFGVPIQNVCEREARTVPYVVDKLLTEIELRGLDEVGLYRVPGAVANIQALKQLFDESDDVSLEDQRWLEINTLAGCFKLYLRELPESLLTAELLPSFIAATKSDNVSENVTNLIKKLPFHNYHLLKRIVQHLYQVTQHSAKNRMDASNLAMVFSMSFLSASDNDVGRSLGSLQSILHMMIKDPETFFINVGYDNNSTLYSGEQEE